MCTHTTPHFLICEFELQDTFDLKIDQVDKITLESSWKVGSDYQFLCLCFLVSMNLRKGKEGMRLDAVGKNLSEVSRVKVAY